MEEERIQYTIGRCRGKELCKKTGISQQQVAEKCGYTKQEVSDWFNDKREINLSAAYTISKFFKVEIDELIKFVSRVPPESRRQQKG